MKEPKKDIQSIEFELISTISNFMKENVGRGPRDIKIKIIDNILIFFVYGVLSPLEKNLLKADDGKTVLLSVRRLYLEVTKDERLSSYEKILNAKVIEHFEGWNFNTDAAVGVIVFDKELQ